MKYLSLIFIFLFAIQVFAQDVTSDELYGSWVRVGDGCRELSEEELLSLAQNGGGNSARRRMVLSIDETTFHGLFLPSLRCEADFQKKESVDFGSQDISPMCRGGVRMGSFKNLGGNIIHLSGENCSDDYSNPWGCGNQMWHVKRVGDALRMNAMGDNDACLTTPFYIYFIPIPVS